MEVLLFAFLAIIVGLGLSFLGYSAFRILLPILGFFAGLWLGMDIVKDFAISYPLLGLSAGVILGLVLGVVFAAASYFIYSLAVVIFGMALGYILGAGLISLFGLPINGVLAIIVGILVAVGMAYAFVKLDMPKFYIMAITAFAGASTLIAGVLALFGQIPPSQLGLGFVNAYIGQSWFWIVIWAILGAVGLAVQYQMSQMSQTFVPDSYAYDVTTKEYASKAKKS